MGPVVSGSRNDLFELLGRVAKAMGNGKRLELIELLVQRPRGVVELARAAGLNVTTTSAHLQTLRQAGLLSTERDGTTIRYSIASREVAALYGQLLTVAATQSAETASALRRHLGPDDTEQVDRDELLRRVSAGQAVLVDVRPTTEYEAAHIPGAVSIPVDELAARLHELPRDLQIVAYCRGVFCSFSHDAVRLLRSHDYHAARLAEGVLEWRIAGYPLTSAAA
jgi:rhodanese-related sulfurtransferase/DNA-binding transcriptional ArsR family regulator